MADTVFTDQVTPIVATWLNDVNKTTYEALGTGGVAPTTAANVVSNLNLVTNTALATSSAASGVGFIQAGTGASAETVQTKLRQVVSVDDFGADNTGSVDSTAAFTAAIAAVNTAGGGTVYCKGTYKISQITYGSTTNVTIQGDMPAYAYDQDQGTGTKFICTTGTWAIRMPATCLYPALKNVSIVSNGALNSTPPCVVVTAGVEYGVLIECGNSYVGYVTINNFQYGAGIANAGNGNIFEYCNFSWNTKAGFFCTLGSTGAYACYHPNLTAPVSLIQSTQFWIRNCNIRRNGWGVILRDGDGVFDGGTIESNFFGGIMGYVGTLDTGVCSYTFTGKHHLENNWAGYTSTVLAASTAYTITQNNLLQVTTGNWPTWTISATNSANYPGYQIYHWATATGTAAGPAGWKFVDERIVLGNPSAQKVASLRASYKPQFIDGSDSSADADGWFMNNGTGTQYATATLFQNFSFSSQPASFGNNGAWWQQDASLGGGFNWIIGASKKSIGTFTGTITNGDMSSNGITGTIGYVTDGNSVTLNLPTSFTGTSASTTFSIAGGPAVISPGTTKYFTVNAQDNGGAFSPAIANINNAGTITIFKNVNSNAFTGSGTKALLQGCSTYSLTE